MTQPTTNEARARLAALIGYEPGEHDALFESHLDTYRAAVLREAADRFAAFDLHTEAAALRRMAEEARS
ncbi:hypothetical protein ABT154_21520 [Streptomyces sp. NPDC001728]|uniref:hypothetical protein n=1 Tax=Streptomyces sp. NPDC001728 TaxID=3154396 RepID=UPI00331E8B24